jgi:uncharacterized protein
MNLTLVLTHACNLRCTYCYAGTPRAAAMSPVTAEQALAFAFAVDDGPHQLGFFGGEPLLEWSLLQSSTAAADTIVGADLVKTVTTNATLLTEARAIWLAEQSFYAGLSIDGNAAMQDATRRGRDGASSHAAAMAGLRAAQQAGLRHQVIVVVDPTNVEHLAASVAYLADRGVRRVSLNPNFYTSWSEEAVALFDQQYAAVADLMLASFRVGDPVDVTVLGSKIVTRLKNGYACGDRCGFGQHEIAVAPSGRLYPCERLVGEDRDHTLCIGTVAAGFDETKRFALLTRKGNRDPECVDCAHRARCMNWCGCINYGTSGDIDSTGPFVCHHEQTLIREADRIADLLFHEGNPHFLQTFYPTA